MSFRFNTRTKRFDSEGKTRGGGIATLVFSIFFLFGLLFFVGLGFHFYNLLSTYSWQALEGEILSSSIVREMEDATDSQPYELKVKYQYSVDGRNFTSARLSISNAEFDSYEDADYYLQQFSEGKKVTVFVDPEVHGKSVLIHDSPWVVLFLFLPLVFMTIGAAGVISLRKAKRRADSPAIAAREEKKRRSGRFILVPIGLIFVVAGSIVFYFMLNDITSALNRDSFKPVPCTILASDIITIESEDSEGRRTRSYKPDVFYECEVAGKTVRASRFRFVNSSGSRSYAQEIIERYSKGKQVTGYVNPDNSRDIVLNKDYGAGILLGLIPPIFVIVGFAVFCAGISSRGSNSVAAHGAWKNAPSATPTPDRSPRPAELSPDGTRGGAVAGVLFFALFWNGITGIFVYHAIADWLSGSGSIFLSIMLIPFVLIGLFFILLFFHQLLSSFNPVIKLNISNIHPAAGEELNVHWRVEGRVDRLSNIVMLLEGEERATYQRGTDTFTAQNTFYRKKLIPEAHGRVTQTGSFNFQVPADSMHSFEAMNNEIVWKIIVRGEIRRWPDAKEVYILNVGPERRGQ